MGAGGFARRLTRTGLKKNRCLWSGELFRLALPHDPRGKPEDKLDRGSIPERFYKTKRSGDGRHDQVVASRGGNGALPFMTRLPMA